MSSEFNEMEHKKQSDVIELLKVVFSSFGIPKQIMTNNNAAHKSFKNFLNNDNFK